MVSMDEDVLTIKIGFDPDADDRRLFRDWEYAKTAPRNVLYLDSVEELLELLTPQKFYLLQWLASMEDQTVSEVAIGTHRKPEAVSRDLHQLSKAGMVTLQKKGTTVSPQMPFSELKIHILINPKPNKKTMGSKRARRKAKNAK